MRWANLRISRTTQCRFSLMKIFTNLAKCRRSCGKLLLRMVNFGKFCSYVRGVQGRLKVNAIFCIPRIWRNIQGSWGPDFPLALTCATCGNRALCQAGVGLQPPRPALNFWTPRQEFLEPHLEPLQNIISREPRVGPAHTLFPPRPFTSSSFTFFFTFTFSYSLYLFSSFVHPFPFYQNSPTPFPGRRS